MFGIRFNWFLGRAGERISLLLGLAIFDVNWEALPRLSAFSGSSGERVESPHYKHFSKY